tara:strand:+ start:22400 stop:23635 length:1236 start_codon:yes stop_codon:yes gene_type:complete
MSLNLKLSGLLFIFSLVIKFAALIYTDGFEREPLEDSLSYHNHAKAIYYGQGFGDNGGKQYEELVESSTRPPALPYILAGLYEAFEPKPWIGRIFNIVVGSLATFVVFLLCFEICQNSKIALFPSIIFLLYPPANYFSVHLLTETLASFFCITATYFFLISLKQNRLSAYVLFGIFSGLLVLTRSQFLLLLPFLFFAVFSLNYFLDTKNHMSLKSVFFSFLAFILILTPWTIRNYSIHDSFMPTTSRLGYMIYLSNHDLEDPEILRGGYSRNAFLNGNYINSFKESEKSAVYMSEVVKEVSDNPLKIIRPMIMRTINNLSYRPNPYKKDYSYSDLIMFFIWIPILLMFFLSLRHSRKEDNWIFFAIIFYNLAVCLPFWGTPRLRFPVDALFIICASMPYIYSKSLRAKKSG